ncbi:MAG: type III-A CRISPR-associated protein Cas10/Csm1 [Desulfobacterales bacterium]|nr:type III-A CRISPR-associated protein Cas10/Csm1 [Desulfobacterales bacterium]
MDETNLKIAMAGFFHDIGKFADKDVMNVSEQYIDNNCFYLPSYNGHYSHRHAVYTAAFIEMNKNFLPEKLNSRDWGEQDSFINLAAFHHKPETPMQWIITIADRISSGMDRESLDKDESVNIQGYKKTRLLPLFEQLKKDGIDNIDKFQYRYQLKEISPDSIFPYLEKDIIPLTKKEAQDEYKELYNQFLEKLKFIKHKNIDIELWFEHFESLIMLFTSSIPAARIGDAIPDVSLYDHLKTTSAIASAIYLYHSKKGNLNDIKSIQNNSDEKFLIVSGNFLGIQNFIFKGFGEERKYRSKILRGRSFAVSLMSELAADLICSEIGLACTSVVLNAAGQFTIIAPNSDNVIEKIKQTEQTINDWLIQHSYGETVITVSHITASCNDFINGNFYKLWEKRGIANNEKKFSRFNIEKHGGAVKNYLDSFNNTLHRPLCPICGKRPSSVEVEKNKYIDEAQSSCKLCRDHIFIGANLVKKNYIAILNKNADIENKNDKLFEPFFGKYQLTFMNPKEYKEYASHGEVIKYWRIGLQYQHDYDYFAVKLINGYIPFYEEEDKFDKRLIAESDSQIERDTPKTLQHIACTARNFIDREKLCGISALGVLKADVDNLGSLMLFGIKDKRLTISRLATLSRQFNNYFAVYLPDFLMTTEKFKNIYTVFAGGDDLFLIGPWNRIIDVVPELKKSFNKYVCYNENIHFSAGISVHKPNTPIDFMADMAEKALDESKDKGKNRVTIFSDTIEFKDLEEIIKIQEQFKQWLDYGVVTSAMFYRLNKLNEMAAYEKKLLNQKKHIHIKDMECTKWRALFAYTSARNTAKNIKDKTERNKIIAMVKAYILGILEEGKLKIPLWYTLYNKR